MSTRQKDSRFKRIIRFLFVGLWESTYRRKRKRGIYSHHAFVSPPRPDQLVYHSRYRWIRKGKKRFPEKD